MKKDKFKFYLLNMVFLTISLLVSTTSIGQESKLASQYYQSGEYEKAGQLYKKLFLESNKNDFYFNRYLESLLALEKFGEAEGVIKDEIKRRPNDVHLYVSYGNIF